MPRRLFHTLAVYGLIGLILNVLVAWGFAAWGSTPVKPVRSLFQFSDPTIDYDPNLTFSLQHPALDAPPIFRLVGRSAGADILLESADGLRDRNGRRHDEELIIARFGWPWRALGWWAITRRDLTDPVVVDPVVAVNIATWPGVSNSPLVSGSPRWVRRLPMCALWPGLAGNTVLYTTTILCTLAVTAALRRSFRLRRGLCPACAYDLRGDHSGGCPECGWGRAARTEPPT